MRLAILTTETLHHTYIVDAINAVHPVDVCLLETRQATFPFPVAHPFEKDRYEYESRLWFDGEAPKVSERYDSIEFHTLNCPDARSALTRISPEAVVIVGTGIIGKETLACCPANTANLHGGDPEYYRGLDSHLWAIYHGEFNQLTVTIHMVETTVDGGDIILKKDLPVELIDDLRMLRAVNSQTAAELAIAALDQSERFGKFLTHSQRRSGRYYSAMPTELKDICVKKFSKWKEAR